MKSCGENPILQKVVCFLLVFAPFLLVVLAASHVPQKAVLDSSRHNRKLDARRDVIDKGSAFERMKRALRTRRQTGNTGQERLVLREHFKQEFPEVPVDGGIHQPSPSLTSKLSVASLTKNGDNSSRLSGQVMSGSGCSSSPCKNGATCSEAEDPWGWGYYCICDWSEARYGGKHCQINNPCTENPCPPEAPACNVAYDDQYGRYCRKDPNVIKITPCSSSPCKNGATCSEARDPWGWGYYCICDWNEGRYGGKHCQISDPCLRSPCPAETPICHAAYEDQYGRNCLKDPNASPCMSAACQNGATCRDDEDPWGWGYYCVCDWSEGRYGGKHCEIVDPCQRYPCPPGTHRCIAGYGNWRGRDCYSKEWSLFREYP